MAIQMDVQLGPVSYADAYWKISRCDDNYLQNQVTVYVSAFPNQAAADTWKDAKAPKVAPLQVVQIPLSDAQVQGLKSAADRKQFLYEEVIKPHEVEEMIPPAEQQRGPKGEVLAYTRKRRIFEAGVDLI